MNLDLLKRLQAFTDDDILKMIDGHESSKSASTNSHPEYLKTGGHQASGGKMSAESDDYLKMTKRYSGIDSGKDKPGLKAKKIKLESFDYTRGREPDYGGT